MARRGPRYLACKMRTCCGTIAAMVSRIFLFFAALLAVPATAFAQDVEGTWALRIDDAIIYVFELERDGDLGWEGSWTSPAEMRNNGLIFSDMSGERQSRLLSATETASFVEFMFESNRMGGVPQVFRIAPGEDGRAELTHIGSGHMPYPLIRVAPGTAIGPFGAERLYDRDNAVSDPDLPMPAAHEEVAIAEPVEEVDPSADAEIDADPAVETETDATVDTVDAEAAPTAESTSGEATARPRLDEDFLEGLGTPQHARSRPARPSAPASRPEPGGEITRACSDFSREKPPSLEELAERWGDEYETVGQGLDIRDYRMDDGRIFRVTVLDDRVFANGCRAAAR